MAVKITSITLLTLIFIGESVGIYITIHGSSQYAVPGRPFTFTCVFNPSGAQSKQLLQNGVTFEAVQLSNDGSDVCYNISSAATICDPSRCSCSQQGDIFTAKWTIPSFYTEYTWRCREFNYLSPSLNLKVAVSVTSVTLDKVNGSQIDVVAGQQISLTCVTGQSRPRSYIEWYIGNDNYTINSTSTVTNGQDEFTSVTSVLTFTSTKEQVNLAVNCKAYNIDPSNTVELVNKPKLKVQYGPDQVIMNPSYLDYTVNETYTLGPIKCSATCEPPCSYKWIKPNQNDIQGDTLMINSMQRAQAGIYKCQAYNAVSSRNSNVVSVTVHYAAKVTHLEINNGNNFTIPEHSTETLTCLAEGLPQPTINLRYISNNSIIKSVSGLRLDFIFPSARCEDTGIYQCDASNKFTSRRLLQKDILVLCKPRARQKPLQHNFILSAGERLNITIPYLAYPRPTLRWFKNVSGGSSVQITDGQQDVKIKNSVVNRYTFVTEFIRTNLKEDGFGTYILRSSNIIGTDENVFTVRPAGKPDKPIGGLATCIGSNSAVITWTSGFNNGDKQSFNIVYQEVDGTEQTLVSHIIDPGVHIPISHTIVSLNELKTYIFKIYSTNSFGESTRLTVNCSTSAKPTIEVLSNTSVAVVVSLASVIILIIIVACIVFSLRRYQNGKGEKDIENVQVDESNLRQEEKVGESNRTNVYNNIETEDGNRIDRGTDKNELKYETLQTPDDQQTYEQIRMEEKPTPTTANRNVYANTAMC